MPHQRVPGQRPKDEEADTHTVLTDKLGEVDLLADMICLSFCLARKFRQQWMVTVMIMMMMLSNADNGNGDE